jgi:hypothetical protein
VTLCLSVVPFAARSQDAPQTDDPEPIVTDRPDFTESAIVVPRGRFQVESGLSYTFGHSGRNFDFPELLLRWGTAPKFEWRLGLPSYNFARADGANASGYDDLYVGAKIQLGPTKQGLDISLIPAAFLPVGSRDFSSKTVDPEVKLCLSKELSARWSVSGMLYGAWTSSEGRRIFTLQTTVSFGQALTNRLHSFYEYAGTFPDRGDSEQFLHSGLAYLLTNNSQLDIHFGFGLSPAAPHSLIAAGYSFRF